MPSRPYRGPLGPDPKADVADELSFHQEMRVRELIARGETPERARELAMQRFGDYRQSQRECVAIDERRKRGLTVTQFFKELKQDIGYTLRTLRRAPAFALVAIVTLALGIGANSAIFSVVNAVLLQSLPFDHADRIYRIGSLYPDGTVYTVSAPDFMSLRENAYAFDQVEAYSVSPLTLSGNGDAREVQAAAVTDGLLKMLGLKTTAGRTFEPVDNQPGRNNIAILDFGFWQRQFGGDTSVLGRSVPLGGRPVTIVGIMANGAKLPAPADLYMPVEYDDTFSASTATDRRSEFLSVVGRARVGQSRASIDTDLQRIGTSLQQWFKGTNDGITFSSTPIRQTIVGDVETPLLMLLGAVGFVLLVACANVANLLLARASARQQEMAVRAALGAGRGRLFRQLMTESVLLSLVGGAAGLALAYAGTRALVAAQPADIPRLDEIGVNASVVLFTLGVSIFTGVVFGSVPAVLSTGKALAHALIGGGRGGATTKRGHQVRAALVVAEMSLAVILLMGAGLLIRSFVALTTVPAGFVADHATTFRLSMQGPAYEKAEQIGLRSAEIEEKLRRLPGVTSVGIATSVPLGGGSMVDFAVDGAPPPPANVNAEIFIVSVTPDYFSAVGVPLRRGRLAELSDTRTSPLVAIVNEAAVKRWFADRDPIGQSVTAGGRKRQIVGVVADVRNRDPRRTPTPQLFVPYTQRTTRTIRVVMRTAGDPMALASPVQGVMRSIDPDIAVTAFSPLSKLIDDSVARPRFYTSLLALFAGVALALAATGIFGVMSYAVAQRSKEISIRIALGARVSGVLGMILGRAMALAAAGIAVGVAAAMLLGRLIQTQLFAVSVYDPITLLGVTVVLGLSAAAASLLPAWRASSIDPAGSLRQG
jgi:predicted permease